MTLSKRYKLFLASVPLLLMIPLMGNLFSSQVNWSFFDFIVMGSLLLIGFSSLELLLKKFKTPSTRLFIVCLILALFLLIWAELAVGILGTPFAGS
ncbi:hypothetical protein [Jiulongibacter sp. NS-SX5]|uniref:hypothetical protein n=1 Tax=Jiulongibacter sp. NS-SX5 TaxID=3463854 RepID=UPI0040593043